MERIRKSAYRKKLRSGYFLSLEQSGKECINIGVEDFSEGNKFRYLDVHAVGFQLGIGTFGHGDTHQV